MIEAVLSGARPWHIQTGDALDVLRAMPERSVEAIVTDPPYGLEFMGKEWDRLGRWDARDKAEKSASLHRDNAPIGSVPTYVGGQQAQEWHHAWAVEALRVAKPGAHLLAFGGTRTYHRLVVGLEDAGWEIRDQLAWLFGSGFPKNRNLGDGLGTALKPAHEPIVLARAPISERTIAANVERWGTGGLAIDACRVPTIGSTAHPPLSTNKSDGWRRPWNEDPAARLASAERREVAHAQRDDLGRWPANVMLDEESADLLDDQTGQLVSGANPTRRGSDKFRDVYGDFAGQADCEPARGLDRGGASRFYYCAKPDRAERNVGLEGYVEKPLNWSSGEQNPGSFQSPTTHRAARNHHPTVKPVALMQWLCRLVCPGGGLVLDPFAGSGTTGIAALREGFRFLGIEREAEYVGIACARIVGDAPLLNHIDDSRTIEEVAAL